MENKQQWYSSIHGALFKGSLAVYQDVHKFEYITQSLIQLG